MPRQTREAIRKALADPQLQLALQRASAAYSQARAKAMQGFDLQAAQNKVRELKERSVERLDDLFARFKSEAESVGAVIHKAATPDEAAALVIEIARERGLRRVVKSKSMLTEEIELNPRLQEAGLEVVETDLGEWIIQLAHEKPSHFTAPALHKTREQVAELFTRATGRHQEPDIAALVDVARASLRQAFIDAELGISGANIAVAETGSLVIVANEGNDRLVTTLPPVHIAVVGYEKLVATQDDANEILKVLARSGTGQKQTAYVSFITGPSRTTDIEKTLALGVHGPKELHIIFVDNGRRQMAADEQCREALYCIKCGACLNLCPVYESVGGHVYGNSYVGGIGSVVTAFHRDLDAAAETLDLCAGCGTCEAICPARVAIPEMVLGLRGRLRQSHGLPAAQKLPLAALRRPGFFQQALRAARLLQSPLVSDGGLRGLPVASGSGILPPLAGRFLRDLLPEASGSGSKMTVTLYAGCMLDFIYPEIGQSIMNVLTRSGVRALFPKGQSCCGAPALYLGDTATAEKLAIDNLLALEQGSPDYIVTGCPTCGAMLRDRFPRLLAGSQWEERAATLAKRVMDFSRFAVDVLDLRPPVGVGGSVTYSDPCHQVRGIGGGDRSRELLRRSGLSLVEMQGSDECCGFAGSYSLKQPEISAAILERKVRHISDTGASEIATDCPGCILQIRGGLSKRGSRSSVRHTATILGERLE